MNRREALQRASLVLGYAVTAPVFSGIMNGCKAEPNVPFAPEFFDKSQAALISQLAETIIPKTDTPGAIEAGVPKFIDKVMKDCYKKGDQKRYLDSIAEFDAECEKVMGDSFLDLDAAKQLEFVTTMNKMAVESWRSIESAKKKLLGQIYSEPFSSDVHKEYGAPEMATAEDSLQLNVYFRTGNFNMLVDKQTNKIKDVIGKADARHCMLTTKELTVSGFFTSEPGATQVLQYEAVPGAFHGCLPLAEVGKTWATS